MTKPTTAASAIQSLTKLAGITQDEAAMLMGRRSVNAYRRLVKGEVSPSLEQMEAWVKVGGSQALFHDPCAKMLMYGITVQQFQDNVRAALVRLEEEGNDQ